MGSKMSIAQNNELLPNLGIPLDRSRQRSSSALLQNLHDKSLKEQEVQKFQDKIKQNSTIKHSQDKTPISSTVITKNSSQTHLVFVKNQEICQQKSFEFHKLVEQEE